MKEDKILIAHGTGGKKMHDLIKDFFCSKFNNPLLNQLEDAAKFPSEDNQIAFSTDSYVVSPLFFPGGDIGKLSICGTVNDVAMRGAIPKFLSVAFIIEEGFLFSDLEKILDSMVKSAEEAKVSIATGDTKVVEKGGADRIFINTAGVGFIPSEVNISASRAQPGDKIIISGSIGDHGITIMSKREGLEFKTKLQSDCAPLNHMVQDMLSVTTDIKVLRDPTRGGLSSALNEVAEMSEVGLIINEESIPINQSVLGACEMLGFDPFQVANEGKLIAIVPADKADEIVKIIQKNKYGKDAVIIGEVIDDSKHRAMVKTAVGATRILDMLIGEQLPRIC